MRRGDGVFPIDDDTMNAAAREGTAGRGWIRSGESPKAISLFNITGGDLGELLRDFFFSLLLVLIYNASELVSKDNTASRFMID